MISQNDFTPRWQVKDSITGETVGVFENRNAAEVLAKHVPEMEIEAYHLLDVTGELTLNSKGAVFVGGTAIEYLVKNALNIIPSREEETPRYVRLTITPAECEETEND